MLTEALGNSNIDVELESTSVTELKGKLIDMYPKLKDMSFKIAVNQSLVNGDCIINKNDEIALLPPFAGG